METCASCGGPLAARAGRRGRSSVYCSAACRQKAYRERQDGGGGLEELIESVGRQAGALVPRPASALYAGVTELSASVARLRRIARLAQETADRSVETADRSVTETPVTEIPGPGSAVSVTDSPVTEFDETAFAVLTEAHRREIRAHCYRMTGSYDDAEDLVQETFLRAWRARDGYQRRAGARTWLYRIATNACLDFQRRTARRPQHYEPLPGMDHGPGEPPARITWLQPCPDDELPDSAAEARETVELVLLAALQHLPARQRAALVLRDLLGLTAAETARALETSVASVNSALQRARPALREHLPASRTDWTATPPTDAQRAALQRYMTAAERLDFDAMAGLLAEDVTLTMPPNPFWFTGRAALLAFLRPSLDPASPLFLGHWRHLPARANGQLAAGGYVRRPGTNVYRAQVLDVLRFDSEDRITEITSFEPHLFPAFGLPLRL
ncbi:RNA polymerase ECF family sigma subunit [Streptomyces puniciscabiei]|uniref:RNA polymerase sigma factor n=1 Tax=Streptomyces puniciscabiei TaxID=164348 RepID=A0A542UJA6_9ACTN|nr:RNA polymerase ECF family sigma subunit [Streptomyces puniciscabiei]